MKAMEAIDIITFSDQLQNRMKKGLDDLKSVQDEQLRARKALTFIKEIIGELRTFTCAYVFRNEDEEIRFFKEVKPVFLSQFYYYKKLFTIELFGSFNDVRGRQNNYYKTLQKLENYVKKNKEFYEYSMTNATFLDQVYFMRS